MAKKVSAVYVKSNEEVCNFIEENKLVMFNAFRKAGLNRCDWEIALNDMARKFAEGKVNYDPNHKQGASMTTYVYTIAKNCALDMIRAQDNVVLDDETWESIRDTRNSFGQIDTENAVVLVKEAFRRLAKDCRDKKKVEMLLRYVVNQEERVGLAEEYGVEFDYLSLVKNRWLPRLQQYVREVLREDEEGKLKLGDFSEINFLKPYMNW